MPPLAVTIIEQIAWAHKPPVGEINGLPSVLLALFSVPVVLVIGGLSSLALKLLKKGNARNYLLAFIAPSIVHMLVFVLAAIRVISGE